MQLCSFLWSVGVATITADTVHCQSLRVVSVVLVTGPSPAGDMVLSECLALGC